MGRVDERHGVVGPQVFFDADDMRDDLPRLLDDDGIADADVFAGNLFDVMQAGAADRRAGDLHRLQIGRRREGAAFADGDEDVVDLGRRFVLLELVGDEPARRFTRGAEPLALVEAVDFEHQAVDFEVEIVEPFDQRLTMRDGGGEIVESLDERRGGKAPLLGELQKLGMRFRREPLAVANAVAEEPKLQLSGQPAGRAGGRRRRPYCACWRRAFAPLPAAWR